MESDGYKKELFEFNDKPRKQFPRIGKILPKADFEGKISFTFGLDRIIFTAIGVILVMVVVFAAGVERGRTIERKALREFTLEVVPAPEPSQEQVSPEPEAAAPTASVSAPVSAAATQPDPDIGAKPYTIVAAAFKGEASASRAADKLSEAGLEAYVTENPPYFVACVGGYTTRKATEDDLQKTRNVYKDAYVKLR